ncbi:glycosyl transferase family 90 [Helicobacter sp. 11S02596-1]|uniref:glycosyl transferase family 90 n=1 Tax=Helicobacter sp. 11S02596-1 TaxID=1476194 RepID=UPI000BA66EEB|nr:glycosyl transferase family 90 [Helicobacter sp. 11S02596-1]PAF43933.1 hypothetical protein BJI48_03860 [Helicobacter sp. 11S02596-1]
MKQNQFLYNLKGISYLLSPRCLGKYALDKKLKKLQILDEITRQAIAKRVNYYCSFAPTATPIPPNPSLLSMLKKGSRYFFDTYEYARFFPKDLAYILEYGDVNYQVPIPALCKSRPITNAPSNNALLKLDKFRHFRFFKPSELKIAYEDKKDTLIFRGACYQAHRQDFMQKYFNHPLCDLGHVGANKPELLAWQKEKISIEKHLQHKFILSLEGNDVASNLKWVMSSNSIAVMPKPKFETWFMEGKLIGNHHYIEIKPDYSDVPERLEYFITHPKEAKEIIFHANAYVQPFLDQNTEELLNILVLRKYFYLTGQIEVSLIEKEIFECKK